MPADHYAVLGVTPDAASSEIRAAYLAVMRANHPDHRPGDAAAAARARDANAAYAVLRDPRRRAVYDRQRAATRAAPTPRMAPPHVEDDGWVSPAELREAARRQAAYSERGHLLRRAFHRASLRAGVAVFAGGLVLLLLVAGGR